MNLSYHLPADIGIENIPDTFSPFYIDVRGADPSRILDVLPATLGSHLE